MSGPIIWAGNDAKMLPSGNLLDSNGNIIAPGTAFAWSTIQPTAGAAILADSVGDTFTFLASDGKCVITGDAAADSLDITHPTLIVGPASAVADRIAIWSGTTGKILKDSVATTATELGYVSGVTSAIQTQFGTKVGTLGTVTDNRLVRTDGTGGVTLQQSGITIDDSDNMTVPGAITSNNGTRSERFGSGSSATQQDGVALGYQAIITTAAAHKCVAVGASASGDGDSGTAVGYDSHSGQNGVAIGRGASTTGVSNTIAVGYGATALFVRGFAFGALASCGADAAHALGNSASAGHQASICIGYSATSTAANQLILGGVSTRSIKNVFIGAGVTDATPDATVTIQPTGGLGSDIVGSALILASGKGTGVSAVSYLAFQTPTVGTTGSTAQTLAERGRFDSTGLKLANVTASRALVSDASSYVTHSATTATELGYVSGVTSAIQTQFTGKANTMTWLSASLGSGGTRDTGAAPTVLGHFRSMLRNASARTYTDTNGAPTFTPTSTEGFRLYNGNTWASADNNNEPSYYQWFIGTGKSYIILATTGTGKSGSVNIKQVSIGSAYVGYADSYDPATGVLTIAPFTSSAHTSHSSGLDNLGNAVNDVYVDIAFW